MLIITRRTGDITDIGGDVGNGPSLFDKAGRPVKIEIVQLGVKGNQVRYGFKVPKHIPVHRREISERIEKQNRGDVDGNRAEEATPTHA